MWRFRKMKVADQEVEAREETITDVAEAVNAEAAEAVDSVHLMAVEKEDLHLLHQEEASLLIEIVSLETKEVAVAEEDLTVEAAPVVASLEDLVEVKC